MDYRVAATDPQPPTRSVARIGGISAGALAASPFLGWQMYDVGFSAPADGSLPRRLLYVFPGRSHAFGRPLVFFGLICANMWCRTAATPAAGCGRSSPHWSFCSTLAARLR